MGEMIQHAVVTLVAAGAAWILMHRVFAAVKPEGPKCSSCASNPAAAKRQELTAEARPLTLIR